MTPLYASAGHNGRDLHVIDVENLLGTPFFRAPWVAVMRRTYDRVSGASGQAQYYVGTSTTRNVFEAGVGWGSGRPVFQCGEDGAERALIDAVADFAEKFDRVVIGSGDGIFAEFAARLQSEGVQVTVVTRRGSLSRRLALAVLDVRYLPDLSMRPGYPATPGRAA